MDERRRSSPPDFLRWLRLPNGRRPRLDWFGHNPFPFRFPRLAEPPLRGRLSRHQRHRHVQPRRSRRAYGRRVPLWLSEYTIQSDRGSDVFATFVSRAAQARYLTAGFRIADDLGGEVAGLGWFGLLDEPPAAGSANWGLLSSRSDASPRSTRLRGLQASGLRRRCACPRSPAAPRCVAAV